MAQADWNWTSAQSPSRIYRYIRTNYLADEIVCIETNIDNMNPEIYPYVIERLISAGAYDAYLIPIVMKKGRPGIILSALVERSKIDLLLISSSVKQRHSAYAFNLSNAKKFAHYKTGQTSFGLVSVK